MESLIDDSLLVPDLSTDGPDWCSNCQSLRQEIKKLQEEQVQNFGKLKQKIISTDLLIKKYKSKCEDYDTQCKRTEEASKRAEKFQRQSEILEAQLTGALLETEPLRNSKASLEAELAKKTIEAQTFSDRLQSLQSATKQFEHLSMTSASDVERLEAEKRELQAKVKYLETGKIRVENAKQFKKEIGVLKKEKTALTKSANNLEKRLAAALAKIEHLKSYNKQNPSPYRRKRCTSGTMLSPPTKTTGTSSPIKSPGSGSPLKSPGSGSSPRGRGRRRTVSERSSSSSQTREPAQKEPGDQKPGDQKPATDNSSDESSSSDTDDNASVYSVSWTFSPLVKCLSPLPPSPACFAVKTVSGESPSEPMSDDDEGLSDCADVLEQELLQGDTNLETESAPSCEEKTKSNEKEETPSNIGKDTVNNETDTVNNEKDTVNNKTDTVNNETDIVKIETDIVNNETGIVKNETDIINNETVTVNNETDTVNNDQYTNESQSELLVPSVPMEETINGVELSSPENICNTQTSNNLSVGSKAGTSGVNSIKALVSPNSSRQVTAQVKDSTELTSDPLLKDSISKSEKSEEKQNSDLVKHVSDNGTKGDEMIGTENTIKTTETSEVQFVNKTRSEEIGQVEEITEAKNDEKDAGNELIENNCCKSKEDNSELKTETKTEDVNVKKMMIITSPPIRRSSRIKSIRESESSETDDKITDSAKNETGKTSICYIDLGEKVKDGKAAREKHQELVRGGTEEFTPVLLTEIETVSDLGAVIDTKQETCAGEVNNKKTVEETKRNEIKQVENKNEPLVGQDKNTSKNYNNIDTGIWMKDSSQVVEKVELLTDEKDQSQVDKEKVIEVWTEDQAEVVKPKSTPPARSCLQRQKAVVTAEQTNKLFEDVESLKKSLHNNAVDMLSIKGNNVDGKGVKKMVVNHKTSAENSERPRKGTEHSENSKSEVVGSLNSDSKSCMLKQNDEILSDSLEEIDYTNDYEVLSRDSKNSTSLPVRHLGDKTESRRIKKSRRKLRQRCKYVDLDSEPVHENQLTNFESKDKHKDRSEGDKYKKISKTDASAPLQRNVQNKDSSETVSKIKPAKRNAETYGEGDTIKSHVEIKDMKVQDKHFDLLGDVEGSNEIESDIGEKSKSLVDMDNEEISVDADKAPSASRQLSTGFSVDVRTIERSHSTDSSKSFRNSPKNSPSRLANVDSLICDTIIEEESELATNKTENNKETESSGQGSSIIFGVEDLLSECGNEDNIVADTSDQVPHFSSQTQSRSSQSSEIKSGLNDTKDGMELKVSPERKSRIIEDGAQPGCSYHYTENRSPFSSYQKTVPGEINDINKSGLNEESAEIQLLSGSVETDDLNGRESQSRCESRSSSPSVGSIDRTSPLSPLSLSPFCFLNPISPLPPSPVGEIDRVSPLSPEHFQEGDDATENVEAEVINTVQQQVVNADKLGVVGDADKSGSVGVADKSGIVDDNNKVGVVDKIRVVIDATKDDVVNDADKLKVHDDSDIGDRATCRTDVERATAITDNQDDILQINQEEDNETVESVEDEINNSDRDDNIQDGIQQITGAGELENDSKEMSVSTQESHKEKVIPPKIKINVDQSSEQSSENKVVNAETKSEVSGTKSKVKRLELKPPGTPKSMMTLIDQMQFSPVPAMISPVKTPKQKTRFKALKSNLVVTKAMNLNDHFVPKSKSKNNVGNQEAAVIKKENDSQGKNQEMIPEPVKFASEVPQTAVKVQPRAVKRRESGEKVENNSVSIKSSPNFNNKTVTDRKDSTMTFSDSGSSEIAKKRAKIVTETSTSATRGFSATNLPGNISKSRNNTMCNKNESLSKTEVNITKNNISKKQMKTETSSKPVKDLVPLAVMNETGDAKEINHHGDSMATVDENTTQLIEEIPGGQDNWAFKRKARLAHRSNIQPLKPAKIQLIEDIVLPQPSALGRKRRSINSGGRPGLEKKTCTDAPAKLLKQKSVRTKEQKEDMKKMQVFLKTTESAESFVATVTTQVGQDRVGTHLLNICIECLSRVRTDSLDVIHRVCTSSECPPIDTQLPFLNDVERKSVQLLQCMIHNSQLTLEMVMSELRASIFSQDATSSVVGKMSVSRVFTALCVLAGDIETVRVLFYAIETCSYLNSWQFVVPVVSIWPETLQKNADDQPGRVTSHGMVLVLEEIVTKTLVAQDTEAGRKILQVLQKLCNWSGNHGNSESILKTLVSKLEQVTSASSTDRSSVFELRKAMELLLRSENWAWGKEQFIMRHGLQRAANKFLATKILVPVSSDFMCVVLNITSSFVNTHMASISSKDMQQMVRNWFMPILSHKTGAAVVKDCCLETLVEISPFFPTILSSIRQWFDVNKNTVQDCMIVKLEQLRCSYKRKYALVCQPFVK